MNSKLLILFILSLISGIIFIAVGIYFLSKKFLEKLNESNSKATPDFQKKNEFRAKGIGYVAMGLGALTLVWGIFLFMFPSLASILALIYMIILIAAFALIMFVFR